MQTSSPPEESSNQTQPDPLKGNRTPPARRGRGRTARDVDGLCREGLNALAEALAGVVDLEVSDQPMTDEELAVIRTAIGVARADLQAIQRRVGGPLDEDSADAHASGPS